MQNKEKIVSLVIVLIIKPIEYIFLPLIKSLLVKMSNYMDLQ